MLRLLLLTALVFVCSRATLAEDRDLGTFRAWSALSFTEDDSVACMMWSEPTQSKGAPEDRREAFMFVTHRPADERLGQVSFETGFDFAPDSEVDIEVGDERYTLYTNGSTAWTEDSSVDDKLVAAMRAGRTMSVRGRSEAGQETEDTFSLLGFTAAHKAITKACK